MTGLLITNGKAQISPFAVGGSLVRAYKDDGTEHVWEPGGPFCLSDYCEGDTFTCQICGQTRCQVFMDERVEGVGNVCSIFMCPELHVLA